MPEVRNADGFTPSAPCGYICSRFDLDKWNDAARFHMQAAHNAGADVTDLRMVELSNPIMLSPFTDLRSAIDRSAGVAQAAFDRWAEALRPRPAPVPVVPTVDPEAEPNGWQWPGLPSLPSFQLPTFEFPPWLWLVAGFIAMQYLSPKRRRS